MKHAYGDLTLCRWCLLYRLINIVCEPMTDNEQQSMDTWNRQICRHCLILIGLISTVLLKSDRDTCCCRYIIHLYSFILFKNEWMLLSQKKNRLIELPINIRHIPYKTYAPLQGPSALVHIDLFRIYMAYNRSCLKSYNAWFIINEWILSHIWNKLLSVNSCSDLGPVTRSYLRTYTCFSTFNTCLSPKIASSYRPLDPIFEQHS